MMTRFAILAAVSLIAFAQPAAAQGKVSATAYKTTLAFAGCAVDADWDNARALLAAEPGSKPANEAADHLLANKTCGDEGSAKAMRGAVAERLYVKQYPAAPAEALGPAAPFTGSGKPDMAYFDITRCAATRDPVGADMLVRSELRSDAEKAALRRIVPVIGSCTPGGAQVGFDREGMRGLLAEGLLTVRAGQGSN